MLPILLRQIKLPQKQLISIIKNATIGNRFKEVLTYVIIKAPKTNRIAQIINEIKIDVKKTFNFKENDCFIDKSKSFINSAPLSFISIQEYGGEFEIILLK